MLTAYNFSYGLVNPVLAYLMSCLGAFLGLRCTARARAVTGREKLRWLLLAALSIGTTGIWVMHFIAMLGYTVPGQVIHYNVLITIASMLLAVVVTGIGLLIVGFGKQNWRTLLAAGTFMGLGVAAMHYTGMAAMRLSGRMTYNPTLFILSVVIAIVASTVALWMGSNLSRVRSTMVAAAIAGVAVSGMHYTGMAALHMWPAGSGGGLSLAGGGATAVGFLLPLLIGISILAFILTATIALSPSSEEMREDAELLQRIAANQNGAYPTPPPVAPPRAQNWPTQAVSRGTQARRQGASTDRPAPP